MTREEAIDCLAVMYERSREGKRVYHNKYQDAFDMAMDALEAQAERTEKRTETHGVCLDAIDRQVAIDAVMEFMPSLTTPDGSGQFDREIFEAQEMFVDIGQALNKLPSAQPEEDCDTCIHGYFGDSQCNNCRVGYPSHYERRIDGQTVSE